MMNMAYFATIGLKNGGMNSNKILLLKMSLQSSDNKAQKKNIT
jgi:hypothetical protein